MKKIIAIVMVIVIISQVPVFGEESHELNIDSKSCVLMESSTGMVLYENNQNEKLSPASITKIMTLVLIFDAIHSGKIKLTDVQQQVLMPKVWEALRFFWKREKPRLWKHL